MYDADERIMTEPLAIDLNGDGIEAIDTEKSNAVYDRNHSKEISVSMTL